MTFSTSLLTEVSRVQSVSLYNGSVTKFLRSGGPSIDDMNRTPFQRMEAAGELESYMPGLGKYLQTILLDRKTGGFVIDIGRHTDDPELQKRVLMGIAALLGNPMIDLLSGKTYGTVRVEPGSSERAEVFQPQAFYHHTDGSIDRGEVNWVVMFKAAQVLATGGRSVLLHVDDWEDFPALAADPLAKKNYVFQGPARRDERQASIGDHVPMLPRERPMFWHDQRLAGGMAFRFSPQYTHPETIDEGVFIGKIARSLRDSRANQYLTLKPGQVVVINNQIWVHGREELQFESGGYRELIRIRGPFRESDLPPATT